MAERIRLQRKKGWRLPAGAVKVDRTTTLGNPFVTGGPNHLGWGEVRDAAHAVWLYRTWLTTPHRSVLYEADRHRKVLERLPALAGKDLACWCTPGAACHADVLLDLANRTAPDVFAAALLEGTVPMTTLERQVGFGQLARALGLEPSDAERYASTTVALIRQHLQEESDRA